MTKKQPSTRPFTTDYGTTKGHCVSKKTALASAMKRVIIDELKHVTLEDERGKVMARIRRDGFWGIFVEVPGKGIQVMPGSEPQHLRRVK